MHALCKTHAPALASLEIQDTVGILSLNVMRNLRGPIPKSCLLLHLPLHVRSCVDALEETCLMPVLRNGISVESKVWYGMQSCSPNLVDPTLTLPLAPGISSTVAACVDQQRRRPRLDHCRHARRHQLLDRDCVRSPLRQRRVQVHSIVKLL
jgi:hypothetical protein